MERVLRWFVSSDLAMDGSDPLEGCNIHNMELKPDILYTAITAAIGKLKPKKAVGIDNITAEV